MAVLRVMLCRNLRFTGRLRMRLKHLGRRSGGNSTELDGEVVHLTPEIRPAVGREFIE